MFKTIYRVLVFVGVLIFQNAYCTGWPVFAGPDRAFLEGHGHIERSLCPIGKGKVKTGARINIRDNLCRTYCAADWEWVLEGKGGCLELEKEVDLLRFDIMHSPDPEEGTSYSEVVAVYGDKRSGIERFRARMKTEPRRHWYCIVMNQELGLVTCANDI